MAQAVLNNTWTLGLSYLLLGILSQWEWAGASLLEDESHMATTQMISNKESEVAQLCPTLCDPMDCSLPSSSVHGIFQARVLEWGAITFSKEILYCVEILSFWSSLSHKSAHPASKASFSTSLSLSFLICIILHRALMIKIYYMSTYIHEAFLVAQW